MFSSRYNVNNNDLKRIRNKSNKITAACQVFTELVLLRLKLTLAVKDNNLQLLQDQQKH